MFEDAHLFHAHVPIILRGKEGPLTEKLSNVPKTRFCGTSNKISGLYG